MFDSCGVRGATYFNPTPFAVAAITIASYDTWPSTCRLQGSSANAVIDTLAISDIACPTWGLSNPFYTTCDGDVYLTATLGEPYNPVILVPTELLAIDPAWGVCSRVPSNGPFVLPCGIYDPPRALHTEGGLIPEVTSVQDPAVTTRQPAQPGPAKASTPQSTTPPTANGDSLIMTANGASLTTNGSIMAAPSSVPSSITATTATACGTNGPSVLSCGIEAGPIALPSEGSLVPKVTSVQDPAVTTRQSAQPGLAKASTTQSTTPPNSNRDPLIVPVNGAALPTTGPGENTAASSPPLPPNVTAAQPLQSDQNPQPGKSNSAAEPASPQGETASPPEDISPTSARQSPSLGLGS